MDGRTHGRTDGRTDDGRKVITIAHPEQSSGELKKQQYSICNVLFSLIVSIYREDTHQQQNTKFFLTSIPSKSKLDANMPKQSNFKYAELMITDETFT